VKDPLPLDFSPEMTIRLSKGTFLRSDSAARIIVTIERPSPDRFSAGPLYMRTPRALRFVLLRVFMPYGGDNRIHAYSTKTHPVLVPAELLANHRYTSPYAAHAG